MEREPADRSSASASHRQQRFFEAVRASKRLLLRPGDFAPSRGDFEVIGAFNPGVAEAAGRVVLLVRIAERPLENRPGFVSLPRYTNGSELTVDWVRRDEVEFVDPRVVQLLETGCVRLTFVSHLRVVTLADADGAPAIEGAAFRPEVPWEEFGVEDPRITAIGNRYYFTYVAVSRHGAATALASTDDFRTFTRHGIIFPPENKDVVLFPEPIDKQYVALHRPNGRTPFTPPEMWVARSADLVAWGGHAPVFAEKSGWESGRVGAGAPPIRTDAGWLEIYHGNRRPTGPGEVGQYVAAALLLDLKDPRRVIARGIEPLFTPTEPFEREGFVADVVFPTGVVAREGSLVVYYGASDTYIGVAELSLQDTLETLQAV
jgi:beta-1,2-mannobiose phosphorylase / 1,2-beta-oligomannan phosphorylase